MLTKEQASDVPSPNWLLTPEAIRERCGKLFSLAKEGKLKHFQYHPERVDETAKFVADVIKQRYPDLNVPFHSRWRHFVFNNEDRWQELSECFGEDKVERSKAAFELAIISVLLDAGAGPNWSYQNKKTGETYRRSEGLALASIDMFKDGLLSDDPQKPYQVLTHQLISLNSSDLEAAFQVSESNPLLGIEGRVCLLNRLGQAIKENHRYFGLKNPRLGNLFDYLVEKSNTGYLEAREILISVLRAFSTIWPGREVWQNCSLGDCWRYKPISSVDEFQGLIPFHKLSQWLSYSLIEPLQWAGVNVTGINQLTGLAEYRNGGLLIDTNLLTLRDIADLNIEHSADSDLIIEWRALTISLLDEIASKVRHILQKSEEELPLCSILEGGTWAAGRKIAAHKRAGGGPPINIIADGTVF